MVPMVRVNISSIVLPHKAVLVCGKCQILVAINIVTEDVINPKKDRREKSLLFFMIFFTKMPIFGDFFYINKVEGYHDKERIL